MLTFRLYSPITILLTHPQGTSREQGRDLYEQPHHSQKWTAFSTGESTGWTMYTPYYHTHNYAILPCMLYSHLTIALFDNNKHRTIPPFFIL